jgi:hypothetical protein
MARIHWEIVMRTRIGGLEGSAGETRDWREKVVLASVIHPLRRSIRTVPSTVPDVST